MGVDTAGWHLPRKMFLSTAQDDMELAPDFFPYFEALVPVLDQDERLLCISSWNDHGQVALIDATWQSIRSSQQSLFCTYFWSNM